MKIIAMATAETDLTLFTDEKQELHVKADTLVAMISSFENHSLTEGVLTLHRKGCGIKEENTGEFAPEIALLHSLGHSA